jgi:hypothetical protein
MPDFKTVTIGQSSEENIMFKPQEPAGFVDEFDLDQITGNGLYATLWRHGGDSPTGEKRIALFRDPSEELVFLRGRVAMLEKYETEFLRLIRDAEAERDLLKDQNTTFAKLLTTSCQFLYASCLTEEISHADEILAVLKAARAEAVGTDISDSKAILDYLASKIVGKTISVDMSTGDDDVGNRIFCTVAELMRDGDSFTILAEDPKQNYIAAEQLAQAQSAIREFIRIDGISVDRSSARNKALIALASFAAMDGDLIDQPAVEVQADAVARLTREVELLHASAETVNEVLVRCRQERNSLRSQVAKALSLAKDAEQNEPHAGFGAIVDALSDLTTSADALKQGEATILGRASDVDLDKVKAEGAGLLGLLWLQISLLEWNRAQPQPLITQGYEYGVAGAVHEMLQQDLAQLLASDSASKVQDLEQQLAGALRDGFGVSAKVLREHEGKAWLGSRGHHTGVIAAAAHLELLAKQAAKLVKAAPSAGDYSREVGTSAPGAGSDVPAE